MKATIDVNELISDREKFNAFIYTPIDQAVSELNRRRNDPVLFKQVSTFLQNRIPEPFLHKPRAVLFRQIATPNYESRRFLSIVDAVGITPLFWEYYKDKFVSNNEVKYYLGKMAFYKGRDKNGSLMRDYKSIIDFNLSNGRCLDSIKTSFGDSLISFHHSLFKKTYRKIPKNYYFDASSWLNINGASAIDYYKNYLLLFTTNAILFENIMLDIREVGFTRDVFLPAFIRAQELTGYKPLIVALEPTEIETDEFWMCHPYESKKYVEKKLHRSKIVNRIKSFILNLWI